MNQTPAQPIVYTCQHCQRTYKSKSGLKYHQKKIPCVFYIDPDLRDQIAPYCGSSQMINF